jgi:hypothetical protein
LPDDHAFEPRQIKMNGCLPFFQGLFSPR